MELYSLNGAWPQQLPNRIIFPDGSTKTDKTTFSENDLQVCGWVKAPPKPTEIFYPNKLDWDGAAWQIREPNSSEVGIRKEEIKQICLNFLNQTDYKVLKAYEASTPVDPATVSYRQALRDLYNSVEEINVWSVVWPEMPDEEDNG